MALSKPAIAARANKRTEAQALAVKVTDAITTHGPMTSVQLRAIIGHVAPGYLGRLVSQGLLKKWASGKHDRNSNVIYIYTMPDCSYTPVLTVLNVVSLWDVWPVSVPKGNGKTQKVAETHSKGNVIYRQPVLQSNHGHLIMMCAG